MLCERVGVNIAHLSRLETGKSQPSGEMLWKIAKALGVSMDYFMDEEADEVTPVCMKDKTFAQHLVRRYSSIRQNIKRRIGRVLTDPLGFASF